LTPGAIPFFALATIVLRGASARATTFRAGFAFVLTARLETGFLVARLLDVVDLEIFLPAAALFALGRAGFAFIARVLADFGEERRTVERDDVDRRKPFVVGLLMRSFNCVAGMLKQPQESGAELNIASLVNQREKGSCGHNKWAIIPLNRMTTTEKNT
jgi:hypothetical protein